MGKNRDKRIMDQIGRIAFRVEGNEWRAYYAMPDSMKDAIYLGSIHMGAVANSPHRRALFMNLMRDVVEALVLAETGLRAEFKHEHQAPEFERGGKA